MYQAEVLIIADDISSARVWADGLRHHSVQSRIIQADQALKSFTASNHYHLVVIDSHNNDQEALSFCREIRPKAPNQSCSSRMSRTTAIRCRLTTPASTNASPSRSACCSFSQGSGMAALRHV